MTIASSHTIAGYSRADGTTARTVTMVRVAESPNGFVLRESLASQPNQLLAQQLTHKSYEVRTKSGDVTRHAMTEWRFPYDLPAAAGIVAGTVTLNRTGLHVPANCPIATRKDIARQMQDMASSTAGTVGYLLVYAPFILGDYAF
jgi:hypothetical protein